MTRVPERAPTPESKEPPAAFIFASLGLLGLGDPLHIPIKCYAVERYYDHLAAVGIVSKLLIFRYIDDGKCKGSDMAIQQGHAGTLHLVPMVTVPSV